MSTAAHYIVFHPENKRQQIFVHAVALEKNGINQNWRGNIWVDCIGIGNEDPYIFNDTWLYSYCHASQLRKNRHWPSYLQTGSKILFVSGQHADKGYLCNRYCFCGW
jgi:hypothetical protein